MRPSLPHTAIISYILHVMVECWNEATEVWSNTAHFCGTALQTTGTKS